MALSRPLSEADLDEMLERTDDVWRALRGARIFLTGGTGFFGVWLLSAFARARQRAGLDASLTVLTRDAASARARHGPVLADAGATLLEGDARTFAFPDGPFSHVIHGATSSSGGRPEETLEVIATGTRRALAFASEAGCSRFLQISSGAVYGPQPPSITHVPEGYAPDPLTLVDERNPYAEGKRVAEVLAKSSARAGGLEVTVARGFAFVAPYLPLDAHFAIGNFLRDGLARSAIEILGDGTPYRSYQYGTDLAVWLWTMLVRGRDGAAYNVGSDDGRPLREVAARVAAATGVAVHVAKEAPPGHVASRYVPDVALARTELGLENCVSLDEGIRRTIAFHRAP